MKNHSPGGVLLSMLKARSGWSERFARGTGVVFILIAIAKLLKLPTLCGPDPWEPVNMVLFPVEIGLGWAMLHPGRGRRIGARLGATVTAGGALLLSIVHFSGGNVRGCGCFGPIELPYGLHMIVCAVLFVACVLVLRSEHHRLRVEALAAPKRSPPRARSRATSGYLAKDCRVVSRKGETRKLEVRLKRPPR